MRRTTECTLAVFERNQARILEGLKGGAFDCVSVEMNYDDPDFLAGNVEVFSRSTQRAMHTEVPIYPTVYLLRPTSDVRERCPDTVREVEIFDMFCRNSDFINLIQSEGVIAVQASLDRMDHRLNFVSVNFSESMRFDLMGMSEHVDMERFLNGDVPNGPDHDTHEISDFR